MLLAALAHERVLRGGTATEVRTLAARALDGGLIAEQTGDSGLVMDAGFAIVTAGDFDRADRGWDEALADVRRRGSVIGFARTSCLRAMLRLPRADCSTPRAKRATPSTWHGSPATGRADGPRRRSSRRSSRRASSTQADAALTTAGLDGDVPDIYMLNFVLFARGVLRLAQAQRRGHSGPRGAPAARGQVGRRQPCRVPVPARCRRRRGGRAAGARVGSRPGRSGARCAPSASSRGDLDRCARARDRRRHAVASRACPHAGRARRGASPQRPPLRGPRTPARRDGARPQVRRAPARRPRAEELLATGARPRRVVRTGVEALRRARAEWPGWRRKG